MNPKNMKKDNSVLGRLRSAHHNLQMLLGYLNGDWTSLDEAMNKIKAIKRKAQASPFDETQRECVRNSMRSIEWAIRRIERQEAKSRKDIIAACDRMIAIGKKKGGK